MKEYFGKNSSKISYFPVFPTLAKFGVFPRTVITGNYRWEFPPLVFPGQPCYLPTSKMMGRSTANIQFFKDGLIFFFLRLNLVYSFDFNDVVVIVLMFKHF